MWSNKIDAEEGILDVPHPALLRYHTAEDIALQFELLWGVRPAAVGLPVTAADGLLIHRGSGSQAANPDRIPQIDANQALGLRYSHYADAQEHFTSLAASAREFAKAGCDIYLVLDPTLPFHNIPALTLTDIVGTDSAPLCVNKPNSQRLLAGVLSQAISETLAALEGTEKNIAGVVLDIVNLWPMSTRGHNIELTCFCNTCQNAFQAGDLLARLRTFPGPLNLALRDSSKGDGIEHMDDLGTLLTEPELVGLSSLRGYTDVFPNEVNQAALQSHAASLKEYMSMRHEMTMEAIKRIFELSFEGIDWGGRDVPERVVITQGTLYDWTSGIQLERLTTREADHLEAIWIPPTDAAVNKLDFPFRAYMARTARYRVDAFFELAASAASPRMRAVTGIGLYSEAEVRGLLEHHMRGALASLLDAPTVGALGHKEGSRRNGITVLQLPDQDLRRFILEIDIPPGVQQVARRDRRRRRTRQQVRREEEPEHEEVE